MRRLIYLLLATVLIHSYVTIEAADIAQLVQENPTFETMGGQIAEIEFVENDGQTKGMHILLDFGQQVRILLGPKWYMDQVEFKPSKGDRVKVTGYIVKKGNVPEMIAYRMEWKGKTYLLRNEKDGSPLWAN